jgi:hypothetical protein
MLRYRTGDGHPFDVNLVSVQPHRPRGRGRPWKWEMWGGGAGMGTDRFDARVTLVEHVCRAIDGAKQVNDRQE